MEKDTINKYIFCDLDGVLNPIHHMNSTYKMYKASFGEIKSHDIYGQLFFNQNCDALKHIIEQTGAKIVISSTWRINGLLTMQEMWKHRNLAGEVIDVTPNCDVIAYKYGKILDEVKRGDEIQHYIDGYNIDKYVIIDDNEDFLKHQLPNFVKCNAYCGLTMKDAEKAIKILNDDRF